MAKQDDYEDDYEDEYEEEEYYEDDDVFASRTPRWLAGTIMSVAVFGFLGLAWYAYSEGSRPVTDGELLFVEADTSPVRTEPDDPGGMQFPHQDKQVFDAISGEGSPDAEIESVMPQPEEPASPEQFAEVTQDDTTQNWVNEKLTTAKPEREALIGDVQETPEQLQALAPAAGDTEAETETETAAPEETVTETPVAETTPAEEPESDTTAEVEEPVETKQEEVQLAAVQEPKPATPSLNGRETIQLGAYREEKDAKASWSKIQGKHAALAAFSPTIIRADLGDKGVYYRLRVQAVNAGAMCSALKSNGQECMVIR